MKKIILMYALCIFIFSQGVKAQTCTELGSVQDFDQNSATVVFDTFPCAGNNQITGMTLIATFAGLDCPAKYAFDLFVNGLVLETEQCSVTYYNLTPYLPVTSIELVTHDTDGQNDNIILVAQVDITYTISTQTEEINKPHEIFVYPSSSDRIIIETYEEQNLLVFDAIGRLILSRFLTEGINIMNLSNQTSGLYFLKFIGSDKIQTFKIFCE